MHKVKDEYRRAADSAVWQILVEECGAQTDSLGHGWEAFDHHWPCSEFRFMGSLGFGGKVWWNGGRPYVTCYREDETPEIREAIKRANNRLQQVWEA